MNKAERIIELYQGGQEIFRRQSVGFLVDEIERLKADLKSIKDRINESSGRGTPADVWQLYTDIGDIVEKALKTLDNTENVV